MHFSVIGKDGFVCTLVEGFDLWSIALFCSHSYQLEFQALVVVGLKEIHEDVLNLLKLLTNQWGIIWAIVNEILKLFDWCEAQISVGLVSPFKNHLEAYLMRISWYLCGKNI